MTIDICARFAASATRLKSCKKGAVAVGPPSPLPPSGRTCAGWVAGGTSDRGSDSEVCPCGASGIPAACEELARVWARGCVWDMADSAAQAETERGAVARGWMEGLGLNGFEGCGMVELRVEEGARVEVEEENVVG